MKAMMLCRDAPWRIVSAIGLGKSTIVFKVKLDSRQLERLQLPQLGKRLHTFEASVELLYWRNNVRTSCELRGLLLPQDGLLRFSISYTCCLEFGTQAGTIEIHY